VVFQDFQVCGGPCDEVLAALEKQGVTSQDLGTVTALDANGTLVTAIPVPACTSGELCQLGAALGFALNPPPASFGPQGSFHCGVVGDESEPFQCMMKCEPNCRLFAAGKEVGSDPTAIDACSCRGNLNTGGIESVIWSKSVDGGKEFVTPCAGTGGGGGGGDPPDPGSGCAPPGEGCWKWQDNTWKKVESGDMATDCHKCVGSEGVYPSEGKGQYAGCVHTTGKYQWGGKCT